MFEKHGEHVVAMKIIDSERNEVVSFRRFRKEADRVECDVKLALPWWSLSLACSFDMGSLVAFRRGLADVFSRQTDAAEFRFSNGRLTARSVPEGALQWSFQADDGRKQCRTEIDVDVTFLPELLEQIDSVVNGSADVDYCDEEPQQETTVAIEYLSRSGGGVQFRLLYQSVDVFIGMPFDVWPEEWYSLTGGLENLRKYGETLRFAPLGYFSQLSFMKSEGAVTIEIDLTNYIFTQESSLKLTAVVDEEHFLCRY